MIMSSSSTPTEFPYFASCENETIWHRSLIEVAREEWRKTAYTAMESGLCEPDCINGPSV